MDELDPPFDGTYHRDSTAEINDKSPITKLRNILTKIDDDVEINSIECCFYDDDEQSRREAQEVILAIIHSNRKIKILGVFNYCKQVAHSQRCYAFVAQCLDGYLNTRIERFVYHGGGAPMMTMNDATRFATIIAQVNDNLKVLSIMCLHGTSNNHDQYLDVFEIIFMVALNKGIPIFRVVTNRQHFKNIIQRACSAGNFKLATNTTLRKLYFDIDNFYIDTVVTSNHLTDEDINPLSTVLATNVGLNYIHVDGCMMLSTMGQNNLMNAVRDNSMLTHKLSVLYPPNHSDNCHYELQGTIKNQIVMNKFWKKFTKRYNTTVIGDTNIRKSNGNTNSTTSHGKSNGSGIDNNNRNGNGDGNDNDNGNIVPTKARNGRKGQHRTIDRRMYPALLKKLTGKPQFLFQFLKSESPTVFGGTLPHALPKEDERMRIP